MLTLEQAIASYEKSAERYHKSFLHCKAHGGEFYQGEAESNKICYEHDCQLSEWLRELQERRKADNEIPFGDSYSFTELDSIINAYEAHGGYYKEVVELLKELRERRKQSEIIYCKDCKHKGTKNCVANAWTTIFGVTVKDDFYCGLAERENDE